MMEIGFFISMLHHVAMLPKDLIVFDTDDFSTPHKDWPDINEFHKRFLFWYSLASLNLLRKYLICEWELYN